jgi:hypothetical protein
MINMLSSASNMPFEWTGHHYNSASPPQVPSLPLRASVKQFGLNTPASQ